MGLNRKRISWLTVAIVLNWLLLFVLIPSVIWAASLYEYYNTGGAGERNCYGQYWNGQSFTPAEAHTITSVKVQGERWTSGSDTLSAEIRSGSVKGSIIASGTVNSNIFPNGSKAWGTISLGAGASLDADTKYWIVLHCAGSNTFYWALDNSSPTYSGGEAYWSSNTGGSYSTQTGVDFMFEDWGEAPPEPPGCPDALDLTDSGGNVITANWTAAENADDYLLRFKRSEYPASVTDGQQAYYGAGLTSDISGLSLQTTKYYFRVWAENAQGYSSCYAEKTIGGEGLMDISGNLLVSLPAGFYVMCFALALIVISFFLKSPLIKIAVILCMLAVVFEPEFKDTWFQAGAVVVMIWAALSGFFTFKQRGGV